MNRREFTHLCAALGGAAIHPPTAAASLLDLIETSSRSIVAVGTYNGLNSPRFNFRGTGFVVGSGQRVITNAHVLPQRAAGGAEAPRAAGSQAVEERLAVLLPRGQNSNDLRLVQRVTSAADHDLAVLDIDGPPLPALSLAGEAAARAGTTIVLIGFPLGSALGAVPVAHRGIVSAVTAIAGPSATARQLDDKTLGRLRQGAFEVLQLDATAYPGTSGSPLIDTETGLVIGVINMVFIKSTKESAIGQPTGISYAIPVRHVSALLAQT